LRRAEGIEDDRRHPHPIGEEPVMPQYLGRFSYSSASVHAMVESPQDREAAAREAVEALGGRLLGFWFALGEFDGVYIAELPDNTAATALAMTAAGAGAMSRFETTPLLGMDEAQEAMRRAGAVSYRAPTG
jgi:uncharacterized protein with GYD domain